MRILHTMLRVADLDKSIAFYTQILGMKVLRQTDYPEGQFTLAFLGFDAESKEAALELTYNWDNRTYDKGDAYGHIAISVDDVYQACERIKQKGGTVIREAGPMKGTDTVIAFVADPDGYAIELLKEPA